MSEDNIIDALLELENDDSTEFKVNYDRLLYSIVNSDLERGTKIFYITELQSIHNIGVYDSKNKANYISVLSYFLSIMTREYESKRESLFSKYDLSLILTTREICSNFVIFNSDDNIKKIVLDECYAVASNGRNYFNAALDNVRQLVNNGIITESEYKKIDSDIERLYGNRYN